MTKIKQTQFYFNCMDTVSFKTYHVCVTCIFGCLLIAYLI